ncbi:acyltransferase domain-containing protein [Rhizobium leguminosarum]|uniref:acyltransferase domain-containing protein n=1 Tax=Rhizobium leguminosarum TaxID=384 RepID=UPI003ED16F62
MAETTTIFMFSGQGSQYYHMGREFFDEHAIFKKTLLDLDEIVASLVSRSVIDILYDRGRKKDEIFGDTVLSSVAIFMIEYALAKALISDGIVPDAVLGCSIGTFAAATIASVMDPKGALTTIVNLTTIIERLCDKGSMIAILENPKLFLEIDDFLANADIAATNFSSHFVISTCDYHVQNIASTLERKNVAFQKLPVHRAFHSRWVEPAKEQFLNSLEGVKFASPIIPLISCAHIESLATVTSESLWRTVRGPIEFERTIAALERQGPKQYIDVGPAGTLATFLKYGLDAASASRVFPLLTPFGGSARNYSVLLSTA